MTKARREFEAALAAEGKSAGTHYVDEGQEFHDLMAEHWQHVKYDEDKARGEVRAGTLGMVEFHRASNDPAVIVYIKQFPRLKGDPKRVAEALEEIAKIVNNFD